MTFSERLWQLLIAIDQFVNTILGGWADETLSARAYRLKWVWTQRFINLLFIDSLHCRDAYESERLRRHLPPEYRQVSS